MVGKQNQNFMPLVFSSWALSVNLGQCSLGESRQRKKQGLERRQKEGKKGMIILLKHGEMASNRIALDMSQTCSNFLFNFTHKLSFIYLEDLLYVGHSCRCCRRGKHHGLMEFTF